MKQQIGFFLKFIMFSVFFFMLSSNAMAGKIDKEPKHSCNFKLKNEEIEKKVLKKERFKLGLALSGGGVRSSAYSIGAMKALYKKGVLKDVEIISAVSGGGYAAYWLLSSEVRNVDSNSSFGDYTFGDSNFTVNTCRFMLTSNFVTYANMLVSLFKYDFPKFYQCKIERTYGWGDINVSEDVDVKTCINKDSESKKIKSYLQYIKDKKIPYFVYNTTVVNNKTDMGWMNGLYEFTALFRGNKSYGYLPWGDDESLPLSQISAISGAAIQPLLKQDIFTPHKDLDMAQIELSDGGHSENLGVIALVRRGVEKIIVVDGEMDSKLEFEGYYILKDRLKAWGLTLENPYLDSLELKNPVDTEQWWARERGESELSEGNFEAFVYDSDDPEKTEISRIYYIKASVVGEVKNDMDKQWLGNGEDDEGSLSYMYNVKGKSLTENAKICDFLELSENNNGKCRNIDKSVSCKSLGKKDFNGIEWIKQNAIIRTHDLETFDGKFPHDTTMDQSYYIDQFTSYMGLGYMQASKIKIDLQQ